MSLKTFGTLKVDIKVVGNAHNHKTDEVYNQLQMNVCTKTLFIG